MWLLIGRGLAKPLGCGAFGGYVAEGAAGIERAAGIVDEDIIQRVAPAPSEASSSLQVPSAASLPRCMIAMRSQWLSASSR